MFFSESGAKPFSGPMLYYGQLNHKGHDSMNFDFENWKLEVKGI